ncbi:MAG: hypothetical protein BWY62_01092 [Firmicutes bacterium ADurb.Bin356]|nr:MAG: hypothetical protein BWY62_01092 [Firmicutes bacterium ADurb.Bin356]
MIKYSITAVLKAAFAKARLNFSVVPAPPLKKCIYSLLKPFSINEPKSESVPNKTSIENAATRSALLKI